MPPFTLLLAAALAAAPVCGKGADEPLRRALLAEINQVREEAGLAPVTPHPALCELARQRAAAVAERGSPQPGYGAVDRMTRQLYRAGYRPHAWTANDLIGVKDENLLDQWRKTEPRAADETLLGDFEEIGIGTARLDGRPVVSIVLGLSARTFEYRQAAPLADLAEVRAAVLAAVNRLRRQAGRPPVTADPALDRAAQRHAEDMLRRAYYDHRSPEGENAAQRVRQAGYDWRVVSENIAKGLFQPAEVVERWMASSDHRENILRRGVTAMGVGVAFGDNARGFEVLWVQVFAG